MLVNRGLKNIGVLALLYHSEAFKQRESFSNFAR